MAATVANDSGQSSERRLHLTS
ncbi:uncharacterized protein G2W53_022171 [Senna tora]|uniref:Uncharacterized protein n=1 Tax=Senna tora TaxID=362788 RepID=A0A834TM79_9FABA|nr:uncharacterized protein G2W53_022171 [Senna tora]